MILCYPARHLLPHQISHVGQDGRESPHKEMLGMLSPTFWITVTILLTLIAFVSLVVCRHAERTGRVHQRLFFSAFFVLAVFTVISFNAQSGLWITSALSLAGMLLGITLNASNEAIDRACP